MEKCESCGNEYDNAFQVIMGGKSHTFDSFECAIQILAPSCEQCDTRIIGHGTQSGGRLFCCANCARASGVAGVEDRAS